jgi:tetratricopeptide (TPR) repeat protein
LLACGVVAVAFGARAADKPIIGPPPAWVKPIKVDMAPPKDTSGAAAGVILADYQSRWSDRGAETYQEAIAKVQTPQGLAALGAFAVAWNPAFDTVTLHRLNIVRDGKVIDVLGDGSKLIVLRREQKLEEATLDGTLTATMQIEGLQVGDIIDAAWTIAHDDPVLAGRILDDIHFNVGSMSHARVRLLWPARSGAKAKSSDWMPPPTYKTNGGETEASVALDDLAPVMLPNDAPPRFRIGRDIELSNFAAWSDISSLMDPLYRKAERITPGSPLEAEAKAIAAASNDPKSRASAALMLVQDKVRYVALTLNGGGLTPAPAELTWSRRFGDCKGKTALLIALLNYLGVAAEPALVSVQQGDGIESRLPNLVPFDHVLVRATIAGRVYWLDGTRVGDTALDQIEIPPFHAALPVRPAGASLVRLEPAPLAKPDSDVSVRLDTSKGLTKPALAHIDMVLRGDGGEQVFLAYAQLTPDQRDMALKAYFKAQYSFIEPTKVTTAYDPASREARLTLDGTAKLDWSGSGYEVDGTRLTSKPSFEREPGLHRDAPYALDFPEFASSTEVITLPDKGRGFSVAGSQVDETVGSVAYVRRMAIKDGVFTMTASRRTLAPEFPASDLDNVKAEMTKLSQADVYVAPPEAAATAASGDLDKLVETGRKALDDGNYAVALGAFDKAAALDDKSVMTFALRSMAHFGLGQFEAARKDDETALALKANDENALLAKGDLATHDLRWSNAFIAYTQAADAEPTDPIPRLRRVIAFEDSGDPAGGLADSEDALKAFPHEQRLHRLRGFLLARLKRPVEAASEAAEIAASDPKDAWLQRSSGDVFKAAGKPAEAVAAADRAIALAPTLENYLARAEFRGEGDVSGVESDAESALKLDPHSLEPIRFLAWVAYQRRDYAKAKGLQDSLVAADPGNASALVTRGDDWARMGQFEQARADFTAARKLGANQAETLNSVCWNEATDNIDLDKALADCDAALKLAPKAADILDSRAFTLLRLGRDDEAISQYSAALDLAPELGPSLYGRSLAERRRGRVAEADRDRAQALAADPHVADDFNRYSLSR